ncbi:MAG: DUF2089 domain-containing protein [Anaerolineales bacterium]|nr:DUF2089 domain-containing protein [Anaerolineales bacterium]
MNQMLSTCPVCDERLSITRFHCRNCDTAIEGHFDIGRFGRLSAEQMDFLEIFVRCEGKLNRMEPELGISYPTLRARLTEIIRSLGFPVGPETKLISDEERHKILDDLASGKLSSEEAMQLLEVD